MRRVGAALLVGLAVCLAGCAPGGRIHRQWVKPGEQVNQRHGVGFYHDFLLEGHKGKQCYVEVRLLDRSGQPITSADGRYQAPDTGQVAARRVVTCLHDRLDGTNLRVFIPYEQLELPAGRQLVVMESRLIAVRDKKVLNVRYEPVTLEIPVKFARAPRTRPARPKQPPKALASARPIKRPTQRPTSAATRAAPPKPPAKRPPKPAAPPKPKRKPPPPKPPKPTIYWFIRLPRAGRVMDGTLTGPYASRASGEIALRSSRGGKLVAKAPSDRVWISTCFDLHSTSQTVRVIGPYDTREAAQRARDDLRRHKSTFGWAFSEVAAMSVGTFVKEYAPRRPAR